MEMGGSGLCGEPGVGDKGEQFLPRSPGGSTGHRELTTAQFLSCPRPKPGQSRNPGLPGPNLCAHPLLSNYSKLGPCAEVQGHSCRRGDRAVAPQCPGEVAMAVSCQPS